MSDPCTPFLQLNPDEVVVLPQTHKNKCTKLGCQSLLRGCRTAGKSQIRFVYTWGSGGRLNFIIIREV